MRLKHKDIPEWRNKRLAEQDNICPLCGYEITKAHADHDHDTGHMRQVLCHYCNPLEGMIRHKFGRSGLKFKVDYIFWLETLVDYLKQDYTDGPLHPTHKEKNERKKTHARGKKKNK